MVSTFNPILKEDKVEKMGLFKKNIPTAPNGKALVYIGNGGEHLTLFPNERPTRGEMRWGKYHVVYTVDLSTKVLELKREFESKDPLEKFNVIIEYTLKVSNPYQVVSNNVNDVAMVLEKQVIRKIERLTTMHTVDNLDELQVALTQLTTDDALFDRLESQGIELADFYLKASLTDATLNRMKQRKEEQVQLELARERQKMKREFEKELETVRRQEEEEHERIRREREQDELRYQREREKLEHELEKQRQAQKEEIDQKELKKQQETRLVKLDYTKKIIAATNDKRELELYLSENQDDIKDALKSLRDKDREDRQEFWDMLVKMKEIGIMDDNYEFVEIFKSMSANQGFVSTGAAHVTQLDSNRPTHFIENPNNLSAEDYNLEEEDDSFNIDSVSEGQKS